MSIFFNVLLGIILGLDAFSLAVSLGSFNKRIKDCKLLIILISLFHFVFPILGSMIGSFIHIPVTELKIIVFFYLMIEMSLDYFNHKPIVVIDYWFNFLLMAFSVSIDSFSIGISLSLSTNILFSCIVFSLFASLFTIIGIILGNRLNKGIGDYANLLGIVLIIILLVCQIISA